MVNSEVSLSLPRIAISLGDPGGIGPEVALRAALHPDVQSLCSPVLVGEPAVVDRAAAVTGLCADGLEIYEPEETPYGDYVIGGVSAVNGAAAYAAVCAAARLALSGSVSAICTAPLSKEAMHLSGRDFPGHTELLAALCGDVPVRMMLEGGGIRVVLETIHVGLARVSSLLTTDGIWDTLRMCDAWGRRYLGRIPKIAVCGFNPHAGENGKFGDEEARVITPAIQAAVSAGVKAEGPLPADTVFFRQLQGDFDLVLAMYHDQGLVAVKTVGFHDGVNLTMGLPFVRTSPDHGTAFGLAGLGTASPDSMISALKRAAQLSRRA